MAGSTDVVVKYRADTSQLHDATEKAKSSLSGIAKIAIGAGVAMAGVFAVRTVQDAISAASELQDQIGASQQIFGDASKAVEQFGETTAEALGIAKTDAIKAANTFATFGKSAGLSGDNLADFATELTTLAGDLASFRGTSPEEAIEAIGSALRGEAEPMRKFGVLLDDATLRARALTMGLIKTTKDALTPQQKVLAAHAEILAQTSDAQGDFGRTSDSAANQQKILGAKIEEVKIAIGNALLPVLSVLLPVLQDLAGWVEDSLIPALGDLADKIIDTLGPAFSAAVDWIKDEFIPALTAIVDWVQDNREEVGSYFTPFMDAARNVIPKIGAIAVAFGKLVIVIAQFLWPKLQDLGDWLSEHREVIGILATTITVALVPAFYAWATAAAAAATSTVVAGIVGAAAFAPILLAIGAVVTALYVVWRLLDESGVRFHHFWGILQTIYNWIQDRWSLLGAILTGPFGWAAKAIYDHWAGITAFFQALPGVIGGFFASLGPILAAPFVWAKDKIGDEIGFVLDYVRGLYNAVARIVVKIIDVLQSIKNAARFPGIPGFGVPGELPGGLAAGGIVRRPTIALIGEAGPEAVVPLRRAGTMPGLGTVNIYVTTTGLGASSPQIQSAVAAALRNYTDRNGAI